MSHTPDGTTLGGTLDGDAPDIWVNDPLPGGTVCGYRFYEADGCRVPTESEPSPDHQKAYRKLLRLD